MGLVAAGLAAVFGAWLVLSVAAQVPGSRLAKRVQRHDVFGLITQWTFFAPSPGTSDLFLVYRVRGEGGWSAWHPVDLVTARGPLAGIWNPGKRRAKALHDMAQDLAAIAALPDLPLTVAQVSTPYVALLNLVVRRAGARSGPTRGGPTHCQFAIAEVNAQSGANDVTLWFRSAVHPLARRTGATQQAAEPPQPAAEPARSAVEPAR